MADLPQRKQNRIEHYDSATPGAYFVTLCTAGRARLFWDGRPQVAPTPNPEDPCRGDLWSPALSDMGMVVESEIRHLNTIYPAVHIDKYCIMPDHIHMILAIRAGDDGRPQVAPTLSRVMQQFKGAVSKKVGRPIWQKSFYDHAIRNQQDYDEIWMYIENNPLKYTLRQGGNMP